MIAFAVEDIGHAVVCIVAVVVVVVFLELVINGGEK